MYDKTIVEALLARFCELSKIVHDFFEYPEVLEVCGLLAGGDLFDFDRKNDCNPIRKRIPEDLSVSSIDKLKAIAVDLRRNLGELICSRIPDAPVDGAHQLSFAGTLGFAEALLEAPTAPVVFDPGAVGQRGELLQS